MSEMPGFLLSLSRRMSEQQVTNISYFIIPKYSSGIDNIAKSGDEWGKSVRKST